MLLLLVAGCDQGQYAATTTSNSRSAASSSPFGKREEGRHLAAGDEPDGPLRTIALNGRKLALLPFRISIPQGLSRSQCGVIVEGQRVLTLGAEDLGAYTCLGIVEIHLLPAGSGNDRVGLLYTGEARTEVYRTATVLVRDPAGRWKVDPDATMVFDDLPVKSWPAFEEALGA